MLLRLAVVLKVCCLACCVAIAAPPTAPLRLVTLEYPPYVVSDNQQPDGVSVWLVQALMQRLQRPYQIEVLPWKRALRRVQIGNADALFPVLKTAEREVDLVYMAQALAEEQVVLFSRHDEVASFDPELLFLRKQRVCVQRGFSIGSRADKLFRDGWMKRINADQQIDCPRMLQRGLARFYLVDRYAGQHVITQSQYQHLVRPFGEPLQATPAYLAWSKKRVDGDVIRAADAALQALHDSGEIEQIWQRFQQQMASP